MKKVSNFAKTTGDFISLSKPDLEIIALAYDLIKKNKKLKYLTNKSKKPVNFKK